MSDDVLHVVLYAALVCTVGITVWTSISARLRARAATRLFGLLLESLRVIVSKGYDSVAEDLRASFEGRHDPRVELDVTVWSGTEATATVLLRREVRGRVLDGQHARLREDVRASFGPVFRELDLGPGKGRAYGAGLPVRQGQDVAAVLTTVRGTPFSASERHAVHEYARALGATVTALQGGQRARLLEELVDTIHAADDVTAVTAGAAEVLSCELGHLGVVVLRYDRGVFRPVAMTGSMSDDLRRYFASGFEVGLGLTWQAYRDGRSRYLDEYASSGSAAPQVVAMGVRAAAAVPLSEGPRSRYILALASQAPRRWNERDRALVEAVRRVLRMALSLAETESRLEKIVTLERELIAGDPDAMPERLLGAAIHLVPGAEAGSLLVRQGAAFRFEAVVGYDADGLANVELTEEDLLRWYAAGREGYRMGEPRMVTTDENTGLSPFSLGMSSLHGTPMRTAGRVDEIVANLCVPVSDQGTIVAVLNLDSLRNRDAFNHDDVEVAKGLQPLIGFALRDAESRRNLELAASTDPLTGLSNRRAFEQHASRAVANAQRYDAPFALLVMDLVGFKRINDVHGHAAGDEALIAVAGALGSVTRAGDVVYRWGGDEFAALAMQAGIDEATNAARRFADAVRGVVVRGEPVRVNIGVAVFDADAGDLDELMRVADRRMYRAKLAGEAVAASDGPEASARPTASA